MARAWTGVAIAVGVLAAIVIGFVASAAALGLGWDESGAMARAGMKYAIAAMALASVAALVGA